MTKTELKNGLVKVTALNGVKDIRNGIIYSEAVVKAQDVMFFVEA